MSLQLPGWSLAVSHPVSPPVLWGLPASTLLLPEAVSLSTGPEHSSSLAIVKVAKKRNITVPPEEPSMNVIG